MMMRAAAGCGAAFFKARAGPRWALPCSASSWTAALRSDLEAPDVPRLAAAARIALAPAEVGEFAPKIKQVVDWFGQLQAVDLESIEPSFRADTEVIVDPRDDFPETFENRKAILAAVPNYEDSFIRVPKVLNKE